MTTQIHPFELAGLGKAPFRYVGIEFQEISHGERVIGSIGGCAITTQPGGTCAFCGHFILNMFNVESSDGQRFHVGCDCIHKVGDPKLSKAVTADEKKMKSSREDRRIAEAQAALPNAFKLQMSPHPTPYQAQQGKTLANYCEWLFSNAGRSGKLRAARMVEAAIAPVCEV